MSYARSVAIEYVNRLPFSVPDQDILSEAYYGLVQAGPRYRRSRGKFKTFVWLRVNGQIQDYVRVLMAIRGKDALNRSIGDAIPDRPTEEQFSTFGLLQQVVADLPTREREFVRLHFVDGMKSREIAKVFHVNESRVSQIKTATLSRLKSALSERGVHQLGDIL